MRVKLIVPLDRTITEVYFSREIDAEIDEEYWNFLNKEGNERALEEFIYDNTDRLVIDGYEIGDYGYGNILLNDMSVTIIK